ncbi:MAG: hypothetical protein ABI220_01845 [Candidatus Saccharimonadales bacterium]
MKVNRKNLVISLPIIILLIISVVVGFMIYQSKHRVQEVNPKALMTVTESGGLCDGPCNRSVNNLYDNGKFEGYKKLSSSEVAKLENIINATDFLKYDSNSRPRCQSFSDGSDQVLFFPQKYGDRSFTPCMLDIPKDDPVFSYIEELMVSHSTE